MPRFLGPTWVAGVGRSIVSRGTASGVGTVIATDAGDAHWFDGAPAYQRETDHAFLEAEGGALLSPRGANRFRAGGSVWAAWLNDGTGYRDSTGRVEPAWSVADVGPDGTIAVVTSRATGIGLRLLNADGTVSDVPNAAPDDQTVHVLRAGAAIWSEGGHQAIRSIGMGDGLGFMTHVGFWLRAILIDGALWLLYQDERDRLVFHPAGDPMGFVLAQGDTFRPDVIADRVVWATHEGERPEDIVVRLASEFPARVDVRLSKLPDKPKPPDKPIDPPIDPPGGPVVTDQQNPFPAFIADLLPAWLAKYPVPQIREGEGDDVFAERMRNWMLPLHEQIEFLAPGKGYGRKRGDPGRPWGKDTIPHVTNLGAGWNGHEILEGEGWDLFTGTSTGHPSFNPNVRSVNLAGQYFETVNAVDHMGVGPGEPPDKPKPPDQPGPVEESIKAIMAVLVAMDERIKTIEDAPPATVDLSKCAKYGDTVTVSVKYLGAAHGRIDGPAALAFMGDGDDKGHKAFWTRLTSALGELIGNVLYGGQR